MIANDDRDGKLLSEARQCAEENRMPAGNSFELKNGRNFTAVQPIPQVVFVDEFRWSAGRRSNLKKIEQITVEDQMPGKSAAIPDQVIDEIAEFLIEEKVFASRILSTIRIEALAKVEVAENDVVMGRLRYPFASLAAAKIARCP